MPLDYEIDSKLKALAPVIDDHAEWFGRVTRRIFYAPAFKGQERLAVPDSFQGWAKQAEGYGFIEKVTLNDLRRLFEELHVVATGITDKAAAGTDPVGLKEYDDFISLYENFIFKLRRLEHDCAMADSGLDVESALRSRAAMEIDINRELERRARRGNPFTLALARIDDYEALLAKSDSQQQRQVLGTLGRLIKKCIRSFDDAYRAGDSEFIMCLKHSQAIGGTAAVNRLRSYLAEEKIRIRVGKKEIPLTMSYCIAEPIPGDTLSELLTNMRADLSKWGQNPNAAVEYHEQSPLQRYIGEDSK